ncbi:MAG: LysR family transcriptional regulator [Alphaproteobacteria bacterium]|nr:LysR family transcriptional regulator [Alphaproteobacteria bacterium]
MINFRYLMVFNAVMRHGTVSGAARMLHLSQPAVTKTLHLLEEDLGITLFSRVRGRLQPTPEADLLRLEVERLTGVAQSIENLTTQLREGHTGKITIAAASTLASSLVARAVSRFHKKWSGVQIHVYAYASREVIRQVINGQVDFAVLDVYADEAEVDAISLPDGEMVCVFRKDHPLSQQESIHVRQLEGLPIISFGDDTRSGLAVREAFRQFDIPFAPSMIVNQTVVACALASHDLGIALVDSFFLSGNLNTNLVARSLAPSIVFQPRVLIRRDRPPSHACEALIAELQVTS